MDPPCIDWHRCHNLSLTYYFENGIEEVWVEGILHLSLYTFVIHECFRRGVCGNDQGTGDMFRWKKRKLLLGCYEGCRVEHVSCCHVATAKSTLIMVWYWVYCSASGVMWTHPYQLASLSLFVPDILYWGWHGRSMSWACELLQLKKNPLNNAIMLYLLNMLWFLF